MASIKRIRWDAFEVDMVHHEGEVFWPRLAACWDSRSGKSGEGIAVYSPEEGEEVIQAVRSDSLDKYWEPGQEEGFVYPHFCHPADSERPFVVFRVVVGWEDPPEGPPVRGICAAQDHGGTTVVVYPPWWAAAPRMVIRTTLVHRYEDNLPVDLWRARLEVARAVAWFWWRYLTARFKNDWPQRRRVAISREAVQRLREAADNYNYWVPPFVWTEGLWWQLPEWRFPDRHGAEEQLWPIPNGDGVVLARAEQ